MVSEDMNNEKLPTIDATRRLVRSLHGEDYFGHLERTECYLLQFIDLLPADTVSDDDVLVGRHVMYLHDAIEDGFSTREELAELGYDDRVLDRVVGLTRDPAKEIYQHKIQTISDSGDLLLILSKCADNKDNSTKERIVTMPPERQSLVRRYRRARTTLHEGLRNTLAARGLAAREISDILTEMASFDTGDY